MPINATFLDELEGKTATVSPPQDYLSPPPPTAKKKTGGINYDFLDSLEAGEAPEVQENKAKMAFDPEGTGYDYETAKAHGLGPDETGHWPSRTPQTGQILKGQKHLTYDKTIAGEEEAGHVITKGQDGKYYSQPSLNIQQKAELSFMPAPEDPQGQLALSEPGPVASAIGKGTETVERTIKQLWNKGVADVAHGLGKSDDPALFKAVEIQKARMVKRKGAGGRKFSEALLDNELKDIVRELGELPQARESDDLKQVKETYTIGEDENPFPKFNIPPGQDAGDYIADTIAGIGTFVAQIYFLRKVLPGAPSQMIWEIQNIATGGKPGRGAAINTALKSISQIPTVSKLGKGAKVTAGGTLFGGLTYMEGGEFVDIAVSTAIGAGFQGWDIHKQNQWLKSFKSHLRKAEYAKSQQAITKGNRQVQQTYQQDLATGMDAAKAKAIYQRKLKGVTQQAGDKLSGMEKKIDQAMDVVSRRLHHGKLKGREPELAKEIVKKGLTREAVAEVAKVRLPKKPKVELAKKGFPPTEERLLKIKPEKGIPGKPENVAIVRSAEGKELGVYPEGTKFTKLPKGATVTIEAMPKQPTKAPPVRTVAPKVGVKPEKGAIIPPKPVQAKPEAKVAKGKVVYHGGQTKITKFDAKKIGTGSKRADWGYGFYFGTERTTAERFGKVITEATLDYKKPYKIEALDPEQTQKFYDEFNVESGTFKQWVQGQTQEQYFKEMKSRGYDAVEVYDKGKLVEMVVFDADQITKPAPAAAKPAKEPWEMTKGEATKTTGNLYYSPFKDLINLEERYRSIQIPKQKVRDAEKLFEAINKGDIDAVLKTEKKYFKAATKGDGWGVGPKPHPRVDSVSRLIGKMAMQGRGALEQHKEAVKKAVAENKSVPLHVLEEYKSEKWAKEALAKPVEVKKPKAKPELVDLGPAPKAKPKKKFEAERMQALKEHFTPGNILYSGYWRKHDRVIDFKETDKGVGWQVTVREVEKQDGKWVAVGDKRTHMTTPSKGDKIVQRAPEVEPVKEIKHEEETITEPAPGPEVVPRKAEKIVPTGKLDPTKPEDAKKIIEEHIKAGGGVGGIFEEKYDREKGGFVVTSVEYTSKQIDTAYRIVQKPIDSLMPDVELFAMPGKEKQIQSIAQKMQKVTGRPKARRKPARLPKAPQLPKAKTSKEDHIKAIYQATSKEQAKVGIRSAINGIKVEGDTIVATDGRRLFWAKGKWGKDGLYLDTASLKKGLLGKPYIGKPDKTGVRFPKWRDILPDVSGEKPLYVNAEAMWHHVRRAASMTTEESRGITIIANKDGSLGFAAASPEIGHAEINVHSELGGRILGAVNPQFLLDAIKFHAIRGNPSFEFYFSDWTRPILTKSSDGKTSTITMPVNPGPEGPKPSEAIRTAMGERPATKGGAGGASIAAAGAEAGGGYGTIAPNEQSTFTEKTDLHRVKQELPDKTSINILDELLKIASPAHRVGSREGARVLRKNLGKLSQETVVAHKTLRKIHHAFTFMNREDVYDFIDRLENGQEQLSPRLTQIAQKFRTMLDERRDAVQALGKGQLENFYENYFPHIWKDSKAAEKAIRQIFGKRRFEGSKSFLKKRTIMTIKEGREVGLELVSENPVDLVLLKLFEMDRYLMAHHVIQDLKARGLIKFVYSRSASPEGYKKIDDRAFTVYMPPEITKKEAYDSVMVDQLMDIARSLGIDTQRFVTLGKGKGRWWGYATWKAKTGEPVQKVRTRYAGPESVLAHEIGHILGIKYQLYDTLRYKKDGAYKEISRGKKKGQQKFVPTEEAVKHRKVIDVEWRALADARIKDKTTAKGFAKYVRKAREKEAVMLEALIHAPEEFKRVAPDLYKGFVKFLNAHSELRPILDIKPSLVLGTSDAKIPVPGFTVLGHYYAPEPVAKILNNYLSPGLRNNENVLVASGYNMTRMMANVINQAQLALSGFHAINVTTDMMASTLGQGVRRLTVKGQRVRGIADVISTPISPILRLWDGVRLRLAYSKQIDTIESENLRNMVKAIVLADGRDRMDPFYYNRQIKALKKTISDVLKGSPVQKIKGVGKLPFNMFGATLESLAAPLMQWYVPTGKLGLFAMLAQHEMQRAESGQINAEQLHERLISSWDSVDNRMGQLVYDNLFWNKTLKDVSMLAVRSVGWNLGSWREYGGVPIDILGTKGRLERGDVLLSQKMAYTIGAVILYATLGAVTMYLLTGKWPEELKDYFFPKTGRKNPNGSDERISFPTYAKDWFAYATQPTKTVTHKVHPLWGLLTDLVTNKDFFSVEVRHPDDPISQQMLDVVKHIGKAFIPISIRNYMKMQKTAPEAKRKNFWVSITGVVSAPSYITRSPAQKLMTQYIIEKIPPKTRTKEDFERSLYRKQLKNRLRKGEPIDEKKAKSVLGKTSFKRMKTDAEKTPFAESFSRLTLYEALNVYAIANPNEQKQSEAILKSKYRRARNITEDMKTMYKELIKQQ